MEQIYDGTSDLKLPNGRTYTASELSKKGFYSPLFCGDPCVIDVENGFLKSFTLLDSMKGQYGVTEDDPERALAECIVKRKEAQEQAKAEAVALSDLQAQMNALSGYTG